jgi:hypothetical protein
MTDAPNVVDEKQLEELSIAIKIAQDKQEEPTE